MFWFIIAIIGYICLALVFILDKKILTDSVDSPVIYTFYSTLLLFVAFLLLPFTSQFITGVDLFWAFVSGISFGLALWTVYIALGIGETTHISPFNGAIVTIATLVFSVLFLSESLSMSQLTGVGILVISSFFLSFEKSQAYNGFHIGFAWAALSGVLFGISHVSAKYIYEMYPFLEGFIWTKGTAGFLALALLAYPSVRASFTKGKKKKNTRTLTLGSFALITANKGLSVLAVVLIQYAAAIGSVTLVFALSGTQFVFMFLFALLFTVATPRFFSEFFTKKEIFVESVALILVVIGSALLVF